MAAAAGREVGGGVKGLGLRTGLRRAATALYRRARLEAAGGGSLYEKLYERHARDFTDDLAVGGKGMVEFDAIGRMELAILRMEGLEPKSTLLDFGCGTGRLAVHVIPYLDGGRYVGTDISPTMIKRGADRVRKAIPNPPCEVVWAHQPSHRFPLPDAGIDMLCAFSVFTHMEHEDAYVYLREAHRVVRPGGCLIFSCLALPVDTARQVFLREAEDGFKGRWRRVRNVTTSRDLMSEIARMAGWTPLRWHAGDEPIPVLKGQPGPSVFGQSVCVLQR
jgi:ubiquinone/menaquinone biosynthesis C-methylase UbiE